MWHGYTLGLLIGLLFAPLCWAGGSAHYRDGVAAARAENFADAREAFLAAASAGMDTPTLHYNLGVVSYHLGDYTSANHHFDRLSIEPEWEALAHYNLGLTADAQGQSRKAQGHFRKAHKTAGNPKLKALAAQRQTDVPKTSSTAGLHYLASSGGYEDNVGLAGETDDFVSDEGDYFVEVIATGGVADSNRNGWRANGGVYYRKYVDLGEFDYGAGALAIEHRSSLGAWSVDVGGQVRLQAVDGELYTNQFALTTTARYRLSPRSKLRVSHDSSYIDGKNEYQYLNGWRHRLRTEVSVDFGEANVSAGYELEVNDRDDLQLDDEFFSYSPTRHELYVGLQRALTRRVSGEAQIDYRISRYADENIEIDIDSIATSQRRKDERFALLLRLEYRVSKSWDLFSEYRFNDNDANFVRRDYSNHLIAIGIQNNF